MYSLRTLSRALPRNVSRAVAASSRTLRYSKPAFVQPAWTSSIARPAYAAFSTSRKVQEKAGQ
ncbi:hypothetical protein KEM55_001236, partial [Ascosphaera atra]